MSWASIHFGLFAPGLTENGRYFSTFHCIWANIEHPAREYFLGKIGQNRKSKFCNTHSNHVTSTAKESGHSHMPHTNHNV